MRKIHKAAVATVLATLMVSSVNPVLAAGEGKPVPARAEQQKPAVPAGMISEAQAIAAMKAMIGEEEAGKLPQVSANYDLSPRFNVPIWNVQLMKAPEPGKTYGSSVYGEVDAKTGQVKRFQFQQAEWKGDKSPSKETAQQVADEFLKTKRPDLYSKIKIRSWTGSGASSSSTPDGKEVRWTHRTIMYNEMVNGIPFLANSVLVDVDEYGHVVGMQESMDFDTKKLPPRWMALPVAKANKLLSEQIEMGKQYTTKTYKLLEDGGYLTAEHLALGYRPESVLSIDAMTGKSVEENYRMSLLKEKRELLKVTGTDGQWVAKDKDEAKRIVEEALNVDLSEMIFHEEKMYNEQYGTDLWFFNWRAETDLKPGQPMNVGATFNAATGQLVNTHLQFPYYYEEPKVVLSMSEARTKALELLASQLGSGENELVMTREADNTKASVSYPKWFDKSKNDYDRWNRPSNTYSFHIAAGHQGLPVVDQMYFVDIDAATGHATHVSLAQNPDWISKLPNNENTIGEREAEEKLLDAYSLELAYIWPQFMDQYAPEGQLVYRFGGDDYRLAYVDAFTGEVVENE